MEIIEGSSFEQLQEKYSRTKEKSPGSLVIVYNKQGISIPEKHSVFFPYIADNEDKLRELKEIAENSQRIYLSNLSTTDLKEFIYNKREPKQTNLGIDEIIKNLIQKNDMVQYFKERIAMESGIPNQNILENGNHTSKSRLVEVKTKNDLEDLEQRITDDSVYLLISNKTVNVPEGMIIRECLKSNKGEFCYAIQKPYERLTERFRIKEVSNNEELSDYIKLMRKSRLAGEDVNPEEFFNKDSNIFLAYEKDKPIATLRIIPKKRVKLPLEFSEGLEQEIPEDSIEITHFYVDETSKNKMAIMLNLFSLSLHQAIVNNSPNIYICVEPEQRIYKEIGFLRTQEKEVMFSGFDKKYDILRLNIDDILFKTNTKNSIQKRIILEALNHKENLLLNLNDWIVKKSGIYKKDLIDGTVDSVKRIINENGLETILEVPTSSGHITKQLAKLGRTTTVDIDPETLDFALEKIDSEHYKNIECRVMDIEKDIPPGKYDLAVLTNILPFIKNPKRALRNVMQSVKQSGYIIITDFEESVFYKEDEFLNKSSDHKSIDEVILWKRLNDMMISVQGIEKSPASKEEINVFLKEGNFKVIEVKEGLFCGHSYRIIAKKD